MKRTYYNITKNKDSGSIISGNVLTYTTDDVVGGLYEAFKLLYNLDLKGRVILYAIMSCVVILDFVMIDILAYFFHN